MARKRKAGDGTVRQRKDGRWEGRIVIGYDDNGYPKTKNVLAKTKKECVEKLQKLKEMDPVHIFPINRDKENAVISRLFSMFSINLVQAKSSKNKGF